MTSSPPDIPPPPQAAPDPLVAAAEDAQSQWQRLGLRIRGITPSGLARGVLVAVVMIGVGWLLWNARAALLPFILGAFLAYALLPVVDWLDRFLPRPLVSVLVVLGFLGLVTLFLWQAIPTIAAQLGQLTLTLPTGERAQARIADVLAYARTLPMPVQNAIRAVLEQEYGKFQTNLSSYFEGLIATAMTGLVQVFNLVALGLAVLVSFPWVMSVINEEPKGVRLTRQLIPEAVRTDVWAVVRIVDRALRAFISGQVVLGIATGLLVFIVVWLAVRLGWIVDGFPAIVASIAGLAQLIPAFGPYLGAVAVFGLGLLTSWERAFILLGLYLLSVFVVNLFLGDRITRRVIPAHPVLVAVIVVAISQLGLVWVLFAAPIIAILRDTVLYFYGRLSQPPRPAGALPSQPVSTATGAASSLPVTTPLAPPAPRRTVVSGARYPPRPIASPPPPDSSL